MLEHSLSSALNFDPDQKLANDIKVLSDAVVVSWSEGSSRGASRPGGVYASDGKWCDTASVWRSAKQRVLLPTEMPKEEEIETLPGTWMFGGMLYGHFGHFLCESTSRLWGVEHSPLPLDGILYIPKKKMSWPQRAVKDHKKFFDTLGLSDMNIRAFNAPVRVERLVVPPQGFGMHAMIAGSPEYRDYVHGNLGHSIAAEGAEKLYISRSKLFVKRGSVLGEDRLEQYLAAEGYEIFHPQVHSIEVQIARYKAARQVVSLDGSALHLAAFFADKNSRFAVLSRRPGELISDFKTQLEKFADVAPSTIIEVYRFWGAGGKAQRNELYSLMDFQAIQKRLLEDGFIQSRKPWLNLNDQELEQALDEISGRMGVPFKEVFFK